MREGTVAYVSGNHVVVRMQDGTVKHVEVPDDQTFDIDGKQVKVGDLKPGTRLMQVVTTTTKDVTVSSIRTVDLRVIQAVPPRLLNVQQTSDGVQKVFTVPAGTTFDVNGKSMKLADLREGMRIKGTVIVKTQNGLSEVTRFTADADGHFRVPLYPGTYLLHPLPGPNGFPHASDQSVQVETDAFTPVNIAYDTGIR